MKADLEAETPPAEPTGPTGTTEYLGKVVLVGITRVSADGEATALLQYHGRISAITREGILIETAEGKQMSLPPALESLQEVPPGEYRERSTGAVVMNPDLISNWEIRASATAGSPPSWSYTRISFPAAEVKQDSRDGGESGPG